MSVRIDLKNVKNFVIFSFPSPLRIVTCLMNFPIFFPHFFKTLNQTTVELLQNAFVSNNDDISIRAAASDYEANKNDVPTDVFDVQFNEIIVNSEPLNIGKKSTYCCL